MQTFRDFFKERNGYALDNPYPHMRTSDYFIALGQAVADFVDEIAKDSEQVKDRQASREMAEALSRSHGQGW